MRSIDVTRPETWEPALSAGADVVARGGMVVLPTDTVYGVGCSPWDATAVARVLAAKGRDGASPSPVLIGERSQLPRLDVAVSRSARALMDTLWPGALTLIVATGGRVARNLGAKADTIAVRMPNHPFARALLRRTGPLAVTSANHTGQPPATTCAQAQQALGTVVELYFDGGSTAGPVPSTIVDLTGAEPVIVRTGVVGPQQVLDAVASAGQDGTP